MLSQGDRSPTNLDITSFGAPPQVELLATRNLLEIVKRNVVRCQDGIGLPGQLCVALYIEQDAAAGNTLLCPSSDAAFEVCVRADDVVLRTSVVEDARFKMAILEVMLALFRDRKARELIKTED